MCSFHVECLSYFIQIFIIIFVKLLNLVGDCFSLSLVCVCRTGSTGTKDIIMERSKFQEERKEVSYLPLSRKAVLL